MSRIIGKTKDGWRIQINFLDWSVPQWPIGSYKWYGPVVLIHPDAKSVGCGMGCCHWVEFRGDKK